MSPFAFLLFCVQNVYSQCLGDGLGLGYAPGYAAEYGPGCGYALGNDFAYGPGLGLGYGLAGPTGLATSSYLAGPPYGGSGIGDVAIAGEMGVAGATLLAGQMPILGAVRFCGEVPAGGVVSIAGTVEVAAEVATGVAAVAVAMVLTCTKTDYENLITSKC
ncbi:unnamed protein product [Parnassius apollo]|uniref:(apollo) hypothetical protein n=1 Tax=Parnassius apollo TaxID=110799 RepID=A0A8S3WFB5_PARAO|nr:unnamed protein product [Parnassius apollo]